MLRSADAHEVLSAAFCVEHRPLLVEQTATWHTGAVGQDAALVHLAMHDVPEQTKLVAQSVLVAQLVLQVVPEHAKLLAQALAALKTQLPLEQLPGSITFWPEQLDEPQEPPLVPVNEHVPLVWQTPLHAATLPRQSLLVQHVPFAMHAFLLWQKTKLFAQG